MSRIRLHLLIGGIETAYPVLERSTSGGPLLVAENIDLTVPALATAEAWFEWDEGLDVVIPSFGALPDFNLETEGTDGTPAWRIVDSGTNSFSVSASLTLFSDAPSEAPTAERRVLRSELLSGYLDAPIGSGPIKVAGGLAWRVPATGPAGPAELPGYADAASGTFPRKPVTGPPGLTWTPLLTSEGGSRQEVTSSYRYEPVFSS